MIFISMFAIATDVCDVTRLSILCFLHTGPANRIAVVFLHVSKKKKNTGNTSTHTDQLLCFF